MTVHRREIKVRVPEWDDGLVVLRELSLGDITDLLGNTLDRVAFAIELVGRCLIDTETDKAVGSTWIRENVGARRLPGLMRLLTHCQDLNGFGEEEPAGKASAPLAGTPTEDETGTSAGKDSRRVRRAANG